MSDEPLFNKRNHDRVERHSNSPKSKHWIPEDGPPIKIQSSPVKKVEKNRGSSPSFNTNPPLVLFQRSYKRVMGKKRLKSNNGLAPIEEEENLTDSLNTKEFQNTEVSEVQELRQQVLSLSDAVKGCLSDLDQNKQALIEVSSLFRSSQEGFSNQIDAIVDRIKLVENSILDSKSKIIRPNEDHEFKFQKLQAFLIALEDKIITTQNSLEENKTKFAQTFKEINSSMDYSKILLENKIDMTQKNHEELKSNYSQLSQDQYYSMQKNEDFLRDLQAKTAWMENSLETKFEGLLEENSIIKSNLQNLTDNLATITSKSNFSNPSFPAERLQVLEDSFSSFQAIINSWFQQNEEITSQVRGKVNQLSDDMLKLCHILMGNSLSLTSCTDINLESNPLIGN